MVQSACVLMCRLNAHRLAIAYRNCKIKLIIAVSYMIIYANNYN